MTHRSTNLFELAFDCLSEIDISEKCSKVNKLSKLLSDDAIDISERQPIVHIAVPGRPSKPILVEPKDVPRRGFDTQSARVRLAHAITHIEFNAINLALDAAYRFQGMPRDYYEDWMQVAVEEAKHFQLLDSYLRKHGRSYGDYPSHNGLWEMAVRTDQDVLIRMALVPRVLEARGLDVTPGMIEKLEHAGDRELVDILNVIHHEEIGHVRIGTNWFNYVCEQRSLDPEITFSKILDEYMMNASFGPFDDLSREQAGFTKTEMKDLMSRSQRNYS